MKNETTIISAHVEDLACSLTDEEVATRGLRMANLESELERHTAYEGQVKASLKATRTRLEAERGKLAGEIRSRSEVRPIEVNSIADFKAGIVTDRRVDTGAVVHERALLAEERQGQLKLNDSLDLA